MADKTEKKTRVAFRHRLEYAGVRFFEGLFLVAPYRLCLLIACVFARFAFHVLRWRRREALRRINQVFPGIAPREANRIAYRSLRTILLNAAELMHLRGLSDEWLTRHVDGYKESMAKLRGATRETGAVLALPHFGNWDLAGIAVAHAGLPIFSIAGVQKNPLTNKWINDKRATGIAILDRGSVAIRQILKRLRGREIFAILPDVRMKTPDLSVTFLGHEANIGRGMALFARKTGSPILLAKVSRTALSRHSLDVVDPIYPDPSLDEEADIRRLATLAMKAVEEQIRSDPGQWFWYNKRWVLEPLAPTGGAEGNVAETLSGRQDAPHAADGAPAPSTEDGHGQN